MKSYRLSSGVVKEQWQIWEELEAWVDGRCWCLRLFDSNLKLSMLLRYERAFALLLSSRGFSLGVQCFHLDWERQAPKTIGSVSFRPAVALLKLDLTCKAPAASPRTVNGRAPFNALTSMYNAGFSF